MQGYKKTAQLFKCYQSSILTLRPALAAKQVIVVFKYNLKGNPDITW